LLRPEEVGWICQLDAIIVIHRLFQLISAGVGVVTIDKLGLLKPPILADVVVPGVVVVPVVGVSTVENEDVLRQSQDMLCPPRRIAQGY